MKLEKTKGFLKRSIVKDEAVKEGTMLHHLGLFSKDSHQLQQPIWVSDVYECAKKYESHAAHMNQPIYYSVFEPSKDLRIANLDGVSLAQACMSVGIYHHDEWNRVLANALTEMEYDGLVYCDREIHISRPAKTLSPVSSATSWV